MKLLREQGIEHLLPAEEAKGESQGEPPAWRFRTYPIVPGQASVIRAACKRAFVPIISRMPGFIAYDA